MEKCNLGMYFKDVKQKPVDGSSQDSGNKPENPVLVITGYANTISKDRSGDVIPVSTWENKGTMDNYLKNPIILGFHKQDQPIGKMVDYRVTELGLEITVEIYDTIEYIYKAIKNGILKTFSIGFWLKDFKYNDTTDSFLLTDIELFEVSVVSVPCNQDSTFSLSKSMTGDEFMQIRDQLKSNKSTHSKPVTEDEDLIVKLARALNCIEKD